MAPCKRKRFAVGSTEEYEETRRLGTGAHGAVVMARHRATGQAVAIKRVGESDPAQCALMRERSFLEACSGNPYVVGLHGVICAPGSFELRLVMECVGSSLRDIFIEREDRGDTSPISESTVRIAMRQLLMGVEKMHGLGIVHRDLKPDNVLVTDDRSTVKICDFGLAMDVSDEAPPYGLAGSWWYMAPEMLLGKARYDAQVDLWSLGCVMAELVAGGSVLFQASNSMGQFRAMVDVLGVPDRRTWPWLFQATTFATDLLPRLRDANRRNLLRERFPENVLSQQGFDVLSGLLTWDPAKRLTASATLKHPWFTNVNAAPAPQAKKEEVTSSALPKTNGKIKIKIRNQPAVDPNVHKRRKLQCT